MLKLIVEDNDYVKASVVESVAESGRPKQLVLRGIFAKAEVLNKNNRKYHFEGLKKEFERLNKEEISKGICLGEFEHPTDNKVLRERAAIKLTKVECDEKNMVWPGEAIVMRSDPEHHIIGLPRADILSAYISFGVPFGFSTRGCGEINEKTRYTEPFTLISVDAVLSPSSGEYSEGILESKEYMIDIHGQIVECALNEFERKVNAAARTYDLDKKREICKAAWDTLLSKI